jgi:hypothetical protein
MLVVLLINQKDYELSEIKQVNINNTFPPLMGIFRPKAMASRFAIFY